MAHEQLIVGAVHTAFILAVLAFSWVRMVSRTSDFTVVSYVLEDLIAHNS